MAKQKAIDITETGPQGFRALQDLNSLDSPNIRPEIRDFIKSSAARRQGYTLYNPYEQAPRDFESPLARTSTAWGESMFDEKNATEEQFKNLEDVRAENQPWYAKIGAGLSKGAILAGTTFLDGTVGLLIGAGTAVKEGRWSALWDNDFSKTMQAINEGSEEILPNYYSQKELEGPWYENVFTANFLGDKFIKNLGFTVGAFYSGSVAASALGATKGAVVGSAKALGASMNTIKNLSNATTHVASAVGAVTSAVNEGRIEALNNSKDWFENQKIQLDDKHFQMLEAIEDQYGGTEMYDALVNKENNNYNQALAKLTEDRLKMGNADLLMNIPILTASNIIQFGKLYARGFKTARRATNITGSPGKYATTLNGWNAAGKTAAVSLSEGVEEVSQKVASLTSGLYYQDDVNNFYKAKMDPEAEEEQLSWLKSFAQGINQAVNEGSTWEEFLIGSLTGALGIPLFRSGTSADGKRQSPIYLEGGIRGSIKEYREQKERETALVNYMNSRVNSPRFKSYYQGLTRHRKYQEDMNKAALENNEFDFKNAEYNQLVSDIIMFDNAGKLEDLKVLINGSFDISDENLESIIKNTTAKDSSGNLVGPYAEFATLDNTGNIVPNLVDDSSKSRMKAALEADKKDMLDTIEEYTNAKTEIEIAVGDKLDNEQTKELTWLKVATDNLLKRNKVLHDELKPLISKTIGYLNNYRDYLRELREAEGARGTIVNGRRTFNVSEQYERLNKSEANMQANIDALGRLSNGSPEIVAALLASDKKLVENLKALVDATPTVTATESQEFSKKVDDIVKIVNLSSTYSKKLNEYLKNPQKKVEDNARAEQQVAQARSQNAQSAIARRINWNGNVSNIASSLEENMNDIESSGGMNEFIKTLTPEQKAKAKKARALLDGIQRVSSMIDDSDDLSDNQKRLAHSLVDNAAKEAEDIKKLGDLISEKLESGEFAAQMAEELKSFEDGVNDLAKEMAVSKAQAILKEFFEDGISRTAKAIDKAEADRRRLEAAEEARMKKTAEALQESSEPSEVPTEPKEPAEPEGMDNTLGTDPSDMSSLKGRDMREYNPKTASPIREGIHRKEDNYRPQLSELYLHGYNMETYLDFIEKVPEAIPVLPEDMTVEEYKNYIRTVHEYLKDNGAFAFVNGTDSNWKMEVGDTITFEHNKELSEKAGTPIVTMVVEKEGKKQVVGTLPTYIDFYSKSRYVELDADGNPVVDGSGNWVWKTSEKTVAENRPEQLALYEAIKDNNLYGDVAEKSLTIPENFETWKANYGNVSSSFNSKLDRIRFDDDGNGGTVEVYVGTIFDAHVLGAIQLANDAGLIQVDRDILRKARENGRMSTELVNSILQSLKEFGILSPKDLVDYIENGGRKTSPITTKVSELRGGKIVFSSNQITVSELFRDKVPVIAVLNESPTLSTGNAVMDSKFLTPTKGIPWQVYVMIPANNGKYLPALCVSTPLAQLADDDWYIQQTIKAIQKIPTSLRDLKENTQNVFKWLNIPGLSIRIGKFTSNGKWQNETSDVSNATHVRFTYTNPNDPEGKARYMSIAIEDGSLSTDSVLKAVRSIISRYNTDAAEAGIHELTTNVDTKKLTDNVEHKEYRKNIARYLVTNVDSNSPHTRNDWFVYEPTQIERETARQKSPAGQRTRPQDRVVHGGTKEVVVEGRPLEVDPNGVVTDPITDEIISMEPIDMGNPAITIPGDISTSAVAFSSPSSVSFGTSQSDSSIAGRRRRPRKGSDMEITESARMEERATADTIEQDLARIKRMFPSLSENGRVLVVNGLRRVHENGNSTEIYGHFRDGILYINASSPRGAGFHEAFHYAVQTLMTESEVNTLFEEARALYGDMSNIALEERLSEDFRHFMNGFDNSSILGKIKSMFRNLKYIIKQITGNINYLDNLFYSMYKGNYANRKEVLEDTFKRDLLRYKNSKVAYEYLSESIRESLMARGISKEDYNNLTTEDKENMIYCIY